MVTRLHPAHRPDLHQMVTELCNPTEHREPYTVMRGTTLIIQYHVTKNPPLITQLHDAATPSTSAEAGTPRPATSRPSAAIDAIDTLIRIDTEAAGWLRHLGHDDPGTTITCIHALASLTPTLDHTTTRDIEHDVRRWWTWARITTRWDQPAWQPDNTCPLCNTRGTLRIRLVEKLATCTDCRETWNPDTIGLLAGHIRHQNGEDHADQQAS